MNTQIIKLSELSEVGDCSLAYGHFDTIHPGHIRYLKFAKSINKNLVVAIIGDIKDHNYFRFKFNQEERSETLAMLDIANFIVCLEKEELSHVVKKLKPKALVLGKEKETPNKVDEDTRKAILLQKKQGGIVEFRAGDLYYALSDLLSTSESELEEKRKEEFRLACKKQNIN